MDALLKKNDLERLRNASIFPRLRLSIDMAFGIAILAVIIASLRSVLAGHVAQGILVLAFLAAVYAFRGVAVLVVDIADMLLEQRALEGKDRATV